MPYIARKGDQVQGTCCGYTVTGTIKTGSSRHTADGLPIARCTDTGTYTGCPNHPNGTFTINGCSSRHTADGLGIARKGDSVQFQAGVGTIVGASSKHQAQ